MALKFYFDTHIARAAAEQLRDQGVDVVRCEEVDMAEASDEAHLVYATEHESVLVSQDADFAVLHAKWQKSGREHAGIMRIPPDLQGQAQISFTVRQLLFYNEADNAGAVDYHTEIRNTIIYL